MFESKLGKQGISEHAARLLTAMIHHNTDMARDERHVWLDHVMHHLLTSREPAWLRYLYCAVCTRDDVNRLQSRYVMAGIQNLEFLEVTPQ